MIRRGALSSLALVGLLVAACAGQGEPPRVLTPSPEVPSVAPAATPTQCSIAVTHLGAFTQRLAGDLAALRPLVVARTFDAGETAGADRLVSETLTAYRGLGAALGPCQQLAGIAVRVATLRGTAEAALRDVLSTPLAGAREHRDGAVALVGLLPEVLALSKAATSAASEMGVHVALATIPPGADRPVGSLAPLPTPTQPPPPTPALTIAASFFGSGVTVTTYDVTGGTPSEISASMHARGPYSAWIGGHATASTQWSPTYRFTFAREGDGTCRIVVRERPAVVATFTIMLPRWRPPAGVAQETVRWWDATLHEIATHEKVHVDDGRAAVGKMNAILETDSCDDAESGLDSVMTAVRRQGCEFDMNEYGSASGLSLEACLAP